MTGVTKRWKSFFRERREILLQLRGPVYANSASFWFGKVAQAATISHDNMLDWYEQMIKWSDWDWHFIRSFMVGKSLLVTLQLLYFFLGFMSLAFAALKPVQPFVALRSTQRPCQSTYPSVDHKSALVITALIAGFTSEKRRIRLARSAAPKEKKKEAFSNKIRTFFGRIYAFLFMPFGGAGNFTQVDQGSVGVVLRFGKFDRMLDPGRHQYNVAVETVKVVPLMLGKFWFTSILALRHSSC